MTHNDFIEETITEGFNCEETKDDKVYYLESLENFIKVLRESIDEEEINEQEEARADLIRKYDFPKEV